MNSFKWMLGDQKKLGERYCKEIQLFMCNDSPLEHLMGPFGRCADFKFLNSTKGQSIRIVQPGIIVVSTVCLYCVFFAKWFLSVLGLFVCERRRFEWPSELLLVLTGCASQWRQRRTLQVWTAGEDLPAKHSSGQLCACGPSDHSSMPLQPNVGSCFYALGIIVSHPPPLIWGFAFCSFNFLWSTEVWKY